MRLSVTIVCCLIFFISCNKGNKYSGEIMTSKKMQAVLWDMMRADQFLTDYVINKNITLDKDEERFKIYNQVFAIHKINKNIYQRSLNYYQSHPELLVVILDSISKPRLVVLKDTIKPKVVSDSLLSGKSILTKKDTITIPRTTIFR